MNDASHLAPLENPDLINREIIRFLETPWSDLNGYYFLELMQ